MEFRISAFGVKQTSRSRSLIPAFDPYRTWRDVRLESAKLFKANTASTAERITAGD